MTSLNGLGWRSMKWLQQRKIVITGEGYYAPPTLLMEEGTERRRLQKTHPCVNTGRLSHLASRAGRKKSETHERLTWEWGVAINTGHELPFSACDVFVDILYVYLATNNKKLYAGLLMRQLGVVITTAGMATTCNLMLSPALPFIWLLMNYSLWLR